MDWNYNELVWIGIKSECRLELQRMSVYWNYNRMIYKSVDVLNEQQIINTSIYLVKRGKCVD